MGSSAAAELALLLGLQYAHPRTLTGASPYVEPGDTSTPDITTYRPTIMAAVPAILELIRGGLVAKVEAGGGIKVRKTETAEQRSARTRPHVTTRCLGCSRCGSRHRH